MCPGRWLAGRDLPELPHADDDLADTGTIIHALWTGKFDPDKHRTPTPEEVDKSYALIEAEETACTEYFGDEWPKTIRFVEQRLTLSIPIPVATSTTCGMEILRCSGQFDVARVHTVSQRVLILDGKTGWNDVTANPRNLQLRWLAGLYYENIGAEEIAVGILKPFGKPSPLCVYSKDDLAKAVLEMESQVRAMFDPNAERVPGEEQCRYCKFRNACPERGEWLSSALPVFPSLPMTISASNWTPEQRASFLDVEKACRDWIDERKEELKALLAKDPEAAPGYALSNGKTLETIVDPAEVHRRFVANLEGATTEAFMPCVKIGKEKFKEAVRFVTGHKGKELTADVDALLKGCTEEKKCEPSIVRVK